MENKTARKSVPRSSQDRSERLEALERGLRVLALFGQGDTHRFAMSDVADRLGITRAAAMRVLSTLEALNYLRLDGRSYALTPSVLSLGYSYLASLGFRAVAQPILHDLVRDTNETCSIGVLDQSDVVYVARVEARRLIRLDLNVGSRLPAHLNSMGRVLLSALSDPALNSVIRNIKLEQITARTVSDKRELKARIVAVRAAGYCYIDGEVEDRIAGLATPIHDAQDRIVAALNMSLGFGRYEEKALYRDLLPRMQAAARQIEMIVRSDVPVA